MQDYRYLGVLSIVLFWVVTAIVLYKWSVDNSKSLSKHIAAQKSSYWLNFAITTPVLLIFYVFMIKWLIPTYHLAAIFKVILIIGVALELIATWVSDTHGLKHWVHHYASYAAALLLPVLNIFIATSNQVTTLTRLVSVIAVLAMVFIFSMGLFIKSSRKQRLVYQCIYFACFHISVLVSIFSVKV